MSAAEELKARTADPTVTPLITVAICTRNRARFLQRAVESVLPQINDDAELLVVDNASTDDTPAVAARLAAGNLRMKVWREAELGLSAARNAALERARGQFVLFLDDDATAEPDWLAAYRRFLSAPPPEKVAVVGGAVFPDFEIPPPKWAHADIVFTRGDSPKRLFPPDSPWGCNIAYRRAAALAIGGFDTQLGRKGEDMMSHEESDLNFRLQNAGHEIWWLPGAAVRHFVPANRLNFRATMRGNFDEGRSVAVQRLKTRRAGWARASYRAARLSVAPFHIAARLLAALWALPANRSKSAGHFFQACRVWGFVTKLLAGLKTR